MSANICKAFKMLFPSGKAFDFIANGNQDKINKSLCQEPENIKLYFDTIRDAGLPGKIPSAFFSDWEDFLGIKNTGELTETQRSQKILAKYISIGGQGKDYVKSILNHAGFDVYIYENLPSDGMRSYTSLMGASYMGDVLMGNYTSRIDPRTLTDGTLLAGSPDYSLQRVYMATMGDMYLGDTQMGGLGDFNGDKIIATEYAIPSTPERYVFFWFIAGQNGLYDFVDIPIERKTDFEEMILQIKPAHTWCIAQINWI